MSLSTILSWNFPWNDYSSKAECKPGPLAVWHQEAGLKKSLFPRKGVNNITIPSVFSWTETKRKFTSNYPNFPTFSTHVKRDGGEVGHEGEEGCGQLPSIFFKKLTNMPPPTPPLSSLGQWKYWKYSCVLYNDEGEWMTAFMKRYCRC